MADVTIILGKDGSIIGVDGEEDGDDTNVDNFSGSGEGDIPSTTPENPQYTVTGNNTYQKASRSPETDLLPYIIAGVAVVVIVIILIVVTIVCCRRRRRRMKHEKSKMGPVAYNPNDQRGGGDGYSTAVLIGDVPQESPPPPPPSSAPPHLSASASSSRYTPLGGRKDTIVAQVDEKNSIYESIDDDKVTNVYEEPKPELPKTNSGRKRVLSSEGDDPSMGDETDHMLPHESKV